MSNDTKQLQFKTMTEEQDISAGNFSSWLCRVREALIDENGVDVPCGSCDACCRSSFFIHIRPGETETLARIPRELLFPAPGLPKGNVVMGYDEQGRCPMWVDETCSIYEHRPITCRNFDCRIFPAVGIEAGDDEKAPINRQILRWKFGYPSEKDRDQHAAVKAAARFLRERSGCFPAGFVPANPTQLAVLAIKVYDVFFGYDASGTNDLEIAQAVMETEKKFQNCDKCKVQLKS